MHSRRAFPAYGGCARLSCKTILFPAAISKEREAIHLHFADELDCFRPAGTRLQPKTGRAELRRWAG